MSPIGDHALPWNDCERWINCAECISVPMLLLENKDFREFIELLNSQKVKFLIVGGHAVTFHGYPRYTGDLDIWVAIDPANAQRIERVLDVSKLELRKRPTLKVPRHAKPRATKGNKRKV